MSIDKAANNVAIICKILYALVMVKEVEFNSGNSNDKNGTYGQIDSIVENDVIHEHKECLFNYHGIDINTKIKVLRWCTGFLRYIKIQLDQDLL